MVLSEDGLGNLCGWPVLPGPPSVPIRSEKPGSHLSQGKAFRGISFYLPTNFEHAGSYFRLDKNRNISSGVECKAQEGKSDNEQDK